MLLAKFHFAPVVFSGVVILGGADMDFIDPARFADDLDVHRRAADLAILDGRVIALGGVGVGGDGFAAMGALDLNLNEHTES